MARTIALALDEDLYDALKLKAAQDGLGRKAMIEDALRKLVGMPVKGSGDTISEPYAYKGSYIGQPGNPSIESK